MCLRNIRRMRRSALHERKEQQGNEELCMRGGEIDWLVCGTKTLQLCCARFGPMFLFRGRAQ